MSTEAIEDLRSLVPARSVGARPTTAERTWYSLYGEPLPMPSPDPEPEGMSDGR